VTSSVVEFNGMQMFFSPHSVGRGHGGSVVTWAAQAKRDVAGTTPDHVRWFTPSYYQDGRQRAQLYGDSSRGGVRVDRVKGPAGGRVLAHSHPHDELVTVIEGTWYLGEGERFDAARLTACAGGELYRRPGRRSSLRGRADRAVIVQVGGVDTFGTDYLEK